MNVGRDRREGEVEIQGFEVNVYRRETVR